MTTFTTRTGSNIDLAALRDQYIDPTIALQRSRREEERQQLGKPIPGFPGLRFGEPLGTPLPEAEPGQKVTTLPPATYKWAIWLSPDEWALEAARRDESRSQTEERALISSDAFGDLSFIYQWDRAGTRLGSFEVPDARQADRNKPRPRQDTQPLYGIDHETGNSFMLLDELGEFISLYREAQKRRVAIDDLTAAREVDTTLNDRFWDEESGQWELTPDSDEWFDGRLDSFQLSNQCQGWHSSRSLEERDELTRPFHQMRRQWQPREVRQATNRLYGRGGLPNPNRKPHTA